MSGLEIAFGIVLMVFAVGIIAIVLLQEGQQKNNSVITGGSSDTFLSKHQGRSIDAFLARWTRFIAIGFFIFVIVVNIILFSPPITPMLAAMKIHPVPQHLPQVSGTESTPAATSSDVEAGASTVTSGTESTASSSASAESSAASSSTLESAANASSESAGSTVSSNA